MKVLEVGRESSARLISFTHSSSDLNISPLSESCWVWAVNITCLYALLLILAAEVGPPISSYNKTTEPFPEWLTRFSAFSSPIIPNLRCEGFDAPTSPFTELFSTAGVGGVMNRPSNVISMSYLRKKPDANLLRVGMVGSPMVAEAWRMQTILRALPI